jgi:hypothetical protein
MFSHRNDEKILLNKAQHIKEIKVNGLENLHKVLNIKDIAEKSLDLYKQQDKNAFGIKINKLFSITPNENSFNLNMDLFDIKSFSAIQNIFFDLENIEYFIIECCGKSCLKMSNVFLINPLNEYTLYINSSDKNNIENITISVDFILF